MLAAEECFPLHTDVVAFIAVAPSLFHVAHSTKVLAVGFQEAGIAACRVQRRRNLNSIFLGRVFLDGQLLDRLDGRMRYESNGSGQVDQLCRAVPIPAIPGLRPLQHPLPVLQYE